MANCNCNDFPISCAPHAPGGDCCHPHSCPPHPCPPPPFKGGTSMYIGARYVPIFADPVEWDDEREYEPLTIVIHDGSCYTSKCYVPKGAQLPPYPEGQTKYWVKTSDYNYQFADLKKTVLDLSRLVEQFQKDNKTFTDLINGWNEKVQQWETEMTAWGERLDAVESRITDLTASLNAEIDRAKAAEQANAAAIAQETADRKQAISELDAAYKAADAAEAQAREEADTALSNRITANKTDIDALKAEQAIQNTNISKNAKNIADNSAEIAKHAARLTDLESNASDWDDVFPDTTLAQEVQKEELERANADTALNGRCDSIAADMEEVRDLANHKVDTTIYTAGQAAQDARIKALEGDNATNKTDIENIKAKDTEQDAAIQQNKDAIAHVTGSLSGYVKTETYTAGQTAQDAKITAAQAAADKANANIGDWETDHPGQTISQCATSLENETAANAAKADANAAVIGDWNAEHPGKTIAQAVSDNTTALDNVVTYGTNGTFTTVSAKKAAYTPVTLDENNIQKARLLVGDADNEFMALPANSFPTRVAFDAFKTYTNNRLDAISGDIPDVSGFVTSTTYTEGQAAQDAKITAAQAAADKANASIGDWETEHPGKTIAQIDVRTYLDELFPEGTVLPGVDIFVDAVFTRHYADQEILSFTVPINVPEIYALYPTAWTVEITPPSYINKVDAKTGTVEQRHVTEMKLQPSGHGYWLYVSFDNPFTSTDNGYYYFNLTNPNGISCSWKKNGIKFSLLPLPGTTPNI